MSLETLMTALRSTNDRRIRDQRVMDSRIRNQVCLELIQIYVQRAIETQRAGNGANDLSDQTVQVLERWTRDIKVATTDVVDSFVVNQEGTVTVLDGGVG